MLKTCSIGTCINVGSASFTGGTVVNALAYDSIHNFLYIGGNFTAVNIGVDIANTTGLAKYNGTVWSTLASNGASLAGGSTAVTGMALDGAGRLYISGTFTSAGGLVAPGLASWYGSSWYTAGSAAPAIYSIATNNFPSSSAMYPMFAVGPLGVYAYDATLIAPRATSFSVAAAGTNALLAYGDARTQMPMAKLFNGSSWSSTPTQVGGAPVTGRIWVSSSADASQNAYLWESNGAIYTKSSRSGAAALFSPPAAAWAFPNLAESIIDATSFVTAIFSAPAGSDGSAVVTGMPVP